MKEFDEVYRSVLTKYDELDLCHWYKMHRAGLVHLVASELDLPEDVVHWIVNTERGPVELDYAEMDDLLEDDDG